MVHLRLMLEFGMYASVRDALPAAFRFEVPLLAFLFLTYLGIPIVLVTT